MPHLKLFKNSAIAVKPFFLKKESLLAKPLVLKGPAKLQLCRVGKKAFRFAKRSLLRKTKALPPY